MIKSSQKHVIVNIHDYGPYCLWKVQFYINRTYAPGKNPSWPFASLPVHHPDSSEKKETISLDFYYRIFAF